MGELSTLVSFEGQDANVRKGRKIPVKTVSIGDLLAEHGAPSVIDYMAIDTEGSEFEILGGLDLSKWTVLAFTIESNYDEAKMSKINKKLLGFGYRIVLPRYTDFDTWYLHPSVVSQFG